MRDLTERRHDRNCRSHWHLKAFVVQLGREEDTIRVVDDGDGDVFGTDTETYGDLVKGEELQRPFLHWPGRR